MNMLDITCIALSAALVAAGGTRAQDIQAPAAAPSAASLTVTFTGIEAKEGALMMAVYDEAGWSTGKPLRGEMLDATKDQVTADITGLTPGRYGVKVFHDVNGNGKMDANPFGMPTEPFAFSNDAHGERGPASWSDAAFDVSADGHAAQTITIR